MPTREDAIYARQSVDRADSISIESQIEYCRYETRGHPCRVYQDRGYSGKNTERPEFQEMLAAVRRGEIRRVICYKLDRCSRSILDFANMIDELQRHKVEFVSCTEKFDTASPMGRAMLNICIVFAQLERETIQQRVTDAYHTRSRRGFYMGGRIPYAFRLEPYILGGKKTSCYTLCREEGDILYQIYQQYADPQTSTGDVLAFLREKGIPNVRAKDGQWTKSYLSSILKNPIYVRADLEIYHFFKSQGTQVVNPPDDFIGINGCYLFTENKDKRKTLSLEGQSLVIAPHEGIIPAELWLKCRKKCLNQKQTARPVKAKNTWLAGKLQCPRCGYALVIKRWKENRYYMCSRHLKDKTACEGVGGIRAEAVEAVVLEALRTKIAGLGSLRSQIPLCDDPKAEELKLRIARIQNEIDDCLSQLPRAGNTVSGYINGKITELDGKKQACFRELRKLEDRQQEKSGIKDCMRFWEELTTKDKMTVTDALIASIRADKEQVCIQWKL